MSTENGKARGHARGRRMLAGVLLVLALAVAMAGCGGDSDEGSLGTADLVIDKTGFKPDEFDLTVGEEVSFSVLNKDSRDHTFTLTFLDIDMPVPAGKRITVKLKTDEVPRDGFYSFYSKAHQTEGYFGRINVKS